MAIAQVIAGARILISDLNAYYSLLKGSAGEAITLIYNATGSVIFQPSSDPATGTELVQIKNNAGTVQSALSSDGKFYAADGVVGTPGVTFEADKDTGLYRSAANTLDLAAGGVQAAEFTATVANFKDGAVGGPGVSFISDPDTGLYSIGANILGLGAGGAEKMRVDATGVSVDAGSSYLGIDPTRHRFRFEPWGAPSGTAPGVITNVGTGTTVINTLGRGVLLNTGTTNPSSTSLRTSVIGSTALTETLTPSKIKRIEIQVCMANVFASDNGYVYFTTESVDVAPSATARHLGIKNLNGTISFTTADGTTEQATAITGSFTAAQLDRVVITFDGTTARCYVNSTLAATHATNVPGAGVNGLILRLFLDNNASINNRSMHVECVEAIIANS